MLVKIRLSTSYQLDYRAFILKHPEIEKELRTKIKWFAKKPEDSRLRNHALTGKLRGYWAFSITNDIRIIYQWIGKNRVSFEGIGGHPKVYDRN